MWPSELPTEQEKWRANKETEKKGGNVPGATGGGGEVLPGLVFSWVPMLVAKALNGKVKYAGIQKRDKALLPCWHVNSI